MTTTTLGAMLQDYEAQELTLLDPGEYQVEIVHVKPRDTDVVPSFKVVAGPYAGKRTMGGVISFKGNAGPRFFGTMRSLGLDKDWFVALGPNLPGPEVAKAVAKALTGRVVTVELNQEAWNDEMRNKLVKVVRVDQVPAGSGAVTGIPQVAAVAAVAPAVAGVPVVAAPPAVAAPPVVAAPAVAAAPVAVAPVPLAAPVAVVPAPVEAVVAAPVAPVGVPVIAAPAVVAAPPVAAVPAVAAPVVEAPVAVAPVVAVAVADEPSF